MRDQLSVRAQGNPELETPTLLDSLETGPANGSRGVDDRTAEILGRIANPGNNGIENGQKTTTVRICTEADRLAHRINEHLANHH